MGGSNSDQARELETRWTRATTEQMSRGRWSFEDEELAGIFEHYVRRHVPFYEEIQRMVGEISDWFVRDGSTVYDLGTSTGECILRIHERQSGRKLRFIAVDNSKEMLDKARVRLREVANVEFVLADLNNFFAFEAADMVTAILLLQFLNPRTRLRLMREIYCGLNVGGAFVLVEKIVAETKRFESIWTALHRDMKKRNGVSEYEITAKESSLRGVLVPYSLDENIRLLRQAGFREIDVFFKWYNWAGILAFKSVP